MTRCSWVDRNNILAAHLTLLKRWATVKSFIRWIRSITQRFTPIEVLEASDFGRSQSPRQKCSSIVIESARTSFHLRAANSETRPTLRIGLLRELSMQAGLALASMSSTLPSNKPSFNPIPLLPECRCWPQTLSVICSPTWIDFASRTERDSIFAGLPRLR